MIEAETQSQWPELHASFMHLQAQIENDIRMRNVATHQAFIWLALMPNEHDAREINDYDFPADGTDAERQARKVVRGLLREFVAERRGEIKKLVDATEPFLEHGHAACNYGASLPASAIKS